MHPSRPNLCRCAPFVGLALCTAALLSGAEPLTPESIRAEAGDVSAEGRHGEKDETLCTIRLALRWDTGTVSGR